MTVSLLVAAVNTAAQTPPPASRVDIAVMWAVVITAAASVLGIWMAIQNNRVRLTASAKAGIATAFTKDDGDAILTSGTIDLRLVNNGRPVSIERLSLEFAGTDPFPFHENEAPPELNPLNRDTAYTCSFWFERIKKVSLQQKPVLQVHLSSNKTKSIKVAGLSDLGTKLSPVPAAVAVDSERDT